MITDSHCTQTCFMILRQSLHTDLLYDHRQSLHTDLLYDHRQSLHTDLLYDHYDSLCPLTCFMITKTVAVH